MNHMSARAFQPGYTHVADVNTQQRLEQQPAEGHLGQVGQSEFLRAIKT